MAVSVSVLPDGSVTVTDGAVTFPPLSPEAVQAIAEIAGTSANASRSRSTTEAVMLLARLIPQAGPTAGADAYASVTVTPGNVEAVLDDVSFALVQANTPRGQVTADGNWKVGPMVIKRKHGADDPPEPAPDPTVPPIEESV